MGLLKGTPWTTGRNIGLKEIALSALTIISPLSFPLRLVDGLSVLNVFSNLALSHPQQTIR
jgi:hypothetical protein